MFNFFKRKPKKTDQTEPQVVQPVLNRGLGIQTMPLQGLPTNAQSQPTWQPEVGVEAQGKVGASEPISVTELAEFILTYEARQKLRQAQECLTNEGIDEFLRRYPELDDGFSDDGPTPIRMLIDLGSRPNPVTVGWCDWKGEDEPGQVLEQVLETSLNLNLTPPSLVPGGIELESLEAFHLADSALQDVGMRLLVIDPDSDMYYFTVVSQTQFGHLNGRRGTDFELKSVTNL